MLGLYRSLRRKLVLRRPMPADWRKTVEKWIPVSAAFEAEERARFDEHVCIFFHEKTFEGVRFDVTDEHKLIISGVAARLSRNVGFEVYDHLHSIILYPDAVAVKRSGLDHGPPGVVEEGELAAGGVAHPMGAVALSWRAVERGLKTQTDGHDTALHELAHIIDMADGAADGTPILANRAAYGDWARVFSEHFLQLQKRPRGSVLDSYGATNEAEFFAVASETFFEKPGALKRKHPELFEALAAFYKIKPYDVALRRRISPD